MHFSLLFFILAELLGNRILLQLVQKVMVCDWWILIRSVFQVLLLVIVMVIDGSEKCKVAFEL